MRSLILIGGAMAGLLAAPLALRPAGAEHPGAQTIVIVSPHDLQTRIEFNTAFVRYAHEELHQDVAVDWRTPGGTGEIQRYLATQFHQAFRRAHPDLLQEGWERFDDAGLDKPGAQAPPGAKAARAAFLAADAPDAVSSGVDLWWGGGVLPQARAADQGYLVDAGLVRAEPTWFTPSCIPQTLSGETVYDPKGRYYGAAFSVFGIGTSLDRVHALGLPVPAQWQDLGEGAWCGTLGIVDPTRSAAAASAFERLIQQQMLEAVEALPAAPAPTASATAAALARGWQDAFTLIRRIGANARDISDGASLSVREVAHGDAAATMCIDFQARAEAEYAQTMSGQERLVFQAPVGGTSVSADPIALLRGAPHRALAVAFLRFVLSHEGQRLWNDRPGIPGGPEHFALRRLPVRRDCYTAEERARMTDPDTDPFALAAHFTYHAAWTGPYYDLMANLVRATVLDPRDELVAAWRAILAAGGPARVPQAYAAFATPIVPYGDAPAAKAGLAGGTATRLALLRAWTLRAQAAYRSARQLADEGR